MYMYNNVYVKVVNFVKIALIIFQILKFKIFSKTQNLKHITTPQKIHTLFYTYVVV